MKAKLYKCTTTELNLKPSAATNDRDLYFLKKGKRGTLKMYKETTFKVKPLSWEGPFPRN